MFIFKGVLSMRFFLHAMGNYFAFSLADSAIGYTTILMFCCTKIKFGSVSRTIEPLLIRPEASIV